MGYTKLSLFGLLVCGLVYYYFTSKKKTEALKKVSIISIITAVISIALSKTAFVGTVDDTLTGRQQIWSYPIAALSDNMRYLWFGSGLNSYWELIDPILPQNRLEEAHHGMLAHNYYLLNVQEMGIVGAGILFLFFISIGKKFFDNFKKYKGYYGTLNMAIFLIVITIFTSSCFGQFYYATYTKILIYIFFAMVLSKENFLQKFLRGEN